MSVQISAISVTSIQTRVSKNLTVHVSVGGTKLSKKFDKSPSQGPCTLELDPVHSLGPNSEFQVQLVKRRYFGFKSTVLGAIIFTIEQAEKILMKHNVPEITAHLVPDGMAEFRFRFSRKPNPGQDALLAGQLVVAEMKSVVQHLGTGYQAFERLLPVFAIIAELNPIAKAVLASIDQVNEILHSEDQCVQAIQLLVTDMAESLDLITNVKQFTKLEELKKRLTEVDGLFQKTAKFLAQYSSRSLGSRLVSFAFSNVMTDELDELTRNFNSFKERFDRGLLVQTGRTVVDMQVQVADMQAHIEFLVNQTALGRDDKHLESLKLKHAKSKRGHQECLEDTRADVLKSIEDWIDDVDGPNLFWLHGHPGTGKSAIATTVRNRLESAKRLGSCFFFRREDFTVQTPESLWCSVGYDLAQQCTSIRQVVLEQSKLHSIDPDVSDYTTILNHLLGAILGVLLPTYPEKLPVIVIDALDECGGREQPRSYQRKLLLALSMWQSHSKQLKIFVTSRDEGDIRRVLGQGGLTSRVLEVGRNVSGTSSSDIKTFFKYRFHEIRQMFMIKEPWPTELQLQSLTDTAAGLFIWASTVVSLVEDGPPVAQLARALKMSTPRSGGTDTLAHLYQDILSSKFIDPLQISLFITVAGTILVARTPLSLEDLAQLFPELETTDVGWACNQLKSVLDVQSGVHFVHQSFVDFLVTRPTDSKFYLNKEHRERRFTAACFSSLDNLHFNMGCIETSYLRNDDISGLRDRIPNHLKYSSQFWATHLKNSGAEAFPRNTVAKFMKSQLLYWLEVMSIEKMVGKAVESLATLMTWSVDTHDEEVTMHVKDALSFVRFFGLPISIAAPHIYLSALVFTPHNSITRKTYLQLIPGVLKLEAGAEMGWSSLQGVLRGHSKGVRSVAFSPDGRHIVSGSSDFTIRIWDANSQQQIGEPLHGSDSEVGCAAFSPDGQYIVVGSSDRIVRIWDASSREQIGEPLRGHTGSVACAAFSPSGRSIASGTTDGEVRIWDTETHLQIGEPLPHPRNLQSVSFSPDGRHIISNAGRVLLWDVASQQLLRELSSSSFSSLAFSPDCRYIVYTHGPNISMGILEVSMQQQIGEALRGHRSYLECAAFSSDGRRLVSGSHDTTIRIWDVYNQQQIGEALHGHTTVVRCVAFSPDGQRVVSCSALDNKVFIWDAESQSQVQQTVPVLEDSKAYVTSVAFSPDGMQIISAGGYDHTIHIWDTHSHQQIREPLRGHKKRVKSIAYSPDGKYIVSAANDSTVRIWSSDSYQEVGEPRVHGHDLMTSVTISPDGRQIISAGYGSIYIWDVNRQQEGADRRCNREAHCLAFSPNGKYFVSGHNYESSLWIWDPQGDQLGEPMDGHTLGVEAVSFSPNGKYLVSASRDHSLRLWDPEKRSQIGEPLHGHLDSVISVAFSPDGSFIVSGSADRAVGIWDTETQQQSGRQLWDHPAAVRSVAVSPNGKYIISGSADVRIWDAEGQRKYSEVLSDPFHTAPVGRRSISGSAHEPDVSQTRGTDPQTDNVSINLLHPGARYLSPALTLKQDGWLVGPNDELLLWTPNHLRHSLPNPFLLGICGGPLMITFDSTNFHHGKDWIRCKTG
ncbi:hypothetical protein DFH09DRAFT_967241 [Mycena vulgaris]|nr:hypothetical protein DFH09DRAFT_967241 [Mycena vulgaris]